MMTSIRSPLGIKVFLVCGSIALTSWLVGNLVLYIGARNSLRQEVRSHIKAVATTAVLQVDSQLHKSIRTPEDESSAAYLRLKHALQAIRSANPGVRYVYTMRKTGKKNVWQFVVDAEENPKNTSHVGDTYDVSRYPEMQNAFRSPSADTKPATDRWGTWLSGYAPIRDSAGNTEAILGLDMSMNGLRREESALRTAALADMLATALVAALLSFLVTRALIKPVRIFTYAARRIHSGDLDFQVQVSGRDEIGEFAEAFNHMITALKESREHMMEQSTSDFLTGLSNHMHFHESLEIELERAERYNRPVCLLILDIDRFKVMNDTLGHPVGDSILLQLGRLLRESSRKVDIPARYGGDEFAIILPDVGIDEGLHAAERLRATIEAHPFQASYLDGMAMIQDNDKAVHITVTIGLAAYPEHHKLRDGLIMAADIALCRAKHISRNSVLVYDPGPAGAGSVDPEDLYQVLRDPNIAAAQSLAAAVDARDRYTSGHSERVTSYALQIAEEIGLNHEQLDAMKIAGLLHDLGKIGVPDAILNKPGSLTQEEREVINRHPSVGGNILRRTPQLELILPAVLFHHERWDGAGYPDGLCGDSIPLMARIMAVADSFDAMTTDRPYRKAMSVEAALFELRANAGKQFDPVVVDAFIAAVSRHVQDMAA